MRPMFFFLNLNGTRKSVGIILITFILLFPFRVRLFDWKEWFDYYTAVPPFTGREFFLDDQHTLAKSFFRLLSSFFFFKKKFLKNYNKNDKNAIS